MGPDRNTLSGPTACRYSYAHRIPIVDSCSTRSGDRVEARLRWFLIEPKLPLLLVLADDPFDVLPRYSQVPLALVELLGGLVVHRHRALTRRLPEKTTAARVG